ncbi:hypothetical protein pb186bvf_010278 [Paramecium bursaria]
MINQNYMQRTSSSTFQSPYYAKNPKGLINVGNNCYLNSIIQMLYNLEPFRRELLQLDTSPVSFTQKLIHHFWELYQSDRESINTKEFYSQFLDTFPQFKYGQQEDAHECLMNILQMIGQENNYPIKMSFWDKVSQFCCINESIQEWEQNRQRENNIITRYFIGQLKNIIKCDQCNFTLEQFEEFQSINIALEDITKTQYLNEVLDNHFKSSILNMYKCKRCHGAVSKIQNIITVFPRVLVLSFKRFAQNNNQIQRINANIAFPLNLVMDNYGERSDNIYALQSIIHHTGSVNYGHYYASCKSKNNWYRFDDWQVDKLDIEKKQYDTFGTPTPYILLYIRK